MFLHNFYSFSLPEIPAFRFIIFRDHNPVSGETKMRCIGIPNNGMRMVHSYLIQLLVHLASDLPFATGGLPGRSPVRNVEFHKQSRHFFQTDIKGAYDHVDAERLTNAICVAERRLLYDHDELYAFLRDYCFLPQRCVDTLQQDLFGPVTGLVTGAPASPLLFNIYAGETIDGHLAWLSKKQGIRYTRYIDDLTFSSHRPIRGNIRREIRKIVEDVGLPINHDKSKCHDLLKNGPLIITGVGLKYGGELFVPRRYLRGIRGMLHRALSGNSSDRAARIHGRISYFRSITTGRQLTASERQVVDLYQRYKNRS